MNHYSSELLEHAVKQFSSLPGIGRKTATRLVLNMLRRGDDEVEEFADALLKAKREIIYCKHCHNISDTEVCPICSDPRRDQTTICVVENIQDVMAIEQTQQYQGLYHVLGGVVSPMEGIGPGDLEIDSLVERVVKAQEETDEENKLNEVILALSSTLEGDTTNFYISRKLKGTGVKISVIARGIQAGSEIEYADELTLGRAILDRKEL
ncbi:MAG: recombination protein RecR [Bacteroidaceae bacterium]|nr:recombination protein RecR [Bacteroidaceae bacterium]